MKKVYVILVITIISIASMLLTSTNQNKTKYIDYNGMQLALIVDGVNHNTMPTGKYFLVTYSCTYDTILTWDYDTSKLTSNNFNVNDSCVLEFESSPKLYDLVKIGDYISYTGDSTNGCSGNRCSGWNASQTNTNLYENYGYCSSSSDKFNTYGWRVLHKTDNSVYIVSAGAPECVAGTSNSATSTKNSLNAAALKYCNNSYLSGGTCNSTTAHAFNRTDFYNFTSQYYGTSNARYLYEYEDTKATSSTYCHTKFSNTYCGYNNDIIDNGGYYWFASAYSSAYTLYWYPGSQTVTHYTPKTYGVRPVLKLDSTIRATGGAGTMTNPYTISKSLLASLNTFTINGTEYQVIEGMTWEEWVESEYNIDDYWIDLDEERVYDAEYGVVRDANDIAIMISPNDTISINSEYITRGYFPMFMRLTVMDVRDILWEDDFESEESITLREWLNSSYNTAGFTTSACFSEEMFGYCLSLNSYFTYEGYYYVWP